MCRVMEDMRNQTLKEGAINSAKRIRYLMENNYGFTLYCNAGI